MDRKHPGAVALGKRRMQGLTDEERQEFARKGAKARVKSMTKTERKKAAQKAAAARWKDKGKK